MVAENFTNFAVTALVTPNPLLSSAGAGSTFTVTASQGALFPAANFSVTMTTEIIWISSRSGDTFTIGSRGFDHSAASNHSAGEVIQLTSTRYTFEHLWQNTPDSFNPIVPPQQVGSSASSYDSEFEPSGGSWVFYPSAGGSSLFTRAYMQSQLLLYRGTNDNITYTAYVSIAGISGAWQATCKLSQATSLLRTHATDQAQVSFFVSDQTNPTAGPDAGNRFKVNTALGLAASGGVASTANCLVRAVSDASGAASFVGTQLPFAPGNPLFLRLTFDGGSTFTAYAGDGLVYWALGAKGGLSFSQNTLGLTFHVYNPSGLWVPQVASVDFVRVDTGLSIGAYGS